MTATKITRSTRYTVAGLLALVKVDTIAATNGVPTRTEIDGGDDIACEIAAWSGWEMQPQEIATPDACSRVTTTIPGRINLPASSIDFYDDREGDTGTITDVFTADEETNLVMMLAGDTAGRLMDIWPVRVNAITKIGSPTGESAVIRRVSFSVTGLPKLDQAIPAAAG